MRLLVVLSLVFLPMVASSKPDESKRRTLPTAVPAGEEPLVDVMAMSDRFLLDLKYATTDNFFGQKVYAVSRCLLRKSVAWRMVQAQAWLDRHHKGLRLLFKDCYRPDDVQWIMWAAVKGTPKASYVANPETATGSIHSYGGAVDLTLADAEGKELDMGTPYDFLGKLAEPRHEERFLKEGKLNEAQVKNRRILREAMLSTGMLMLKNEWWHFNADTPATVKKKFSRLNVPLGAVPGD
jgi:D-alanyl-D-alanine dipeptidase